MDGKVFKVPFLYTFYTCCILRDLESIDSGVGKIREVRKHCYRARIPVRNATPSNVVDKFHLSRLCQISKEVNVFGNKGLENLQPDHWKHNWLIHGIVRGLWQL